MFAFSNIMAPEHRFELSSGTAIGSKKPLRATKCLPLAIWLRSIDSSLQAVRRYDPINPYSINEYPLIGQCIQLVIVNSINNRECKCLAERKRE